jgi:hypothetical protein
MEQVIGGIKELSEEYSFKRIDEERVTLAAYGRGADDGYFFWGELTQVHMRDALANGIDWEGFTEAQEQDVIGRVIDGQAPEFWMDGVEMDDPRDERPADSMPIDEHDGQRLEGGLDAIRDTTRNLLEAIALDAWPRAGAIVDFGLDGQEHYEALYHGVRNGEITPEALDAALGRGDRLTALARAAASNPHRDVEFHTSWDALRGREEPAGPEASDGPPESGRGEARPGVRVETPRETDERRKYLLFKGAPMPEGWTLPPWRDPPEFSDPDALRRAGGEAASLAEARFESWRPVSFGAGAAAAPGATGRWDELTEFGKLDVMQHWVDWAGVSHKDRAATMAARLDLDGLSPALRERLKQDAGLDVQPTGVQETAPVEDKAPLSPGDRVEDQLPPPTLHYLDLAGFLTLSDTPLEPLENQIREQMAAANPAAEGSYPDIYEGSLITSGQDSIGPEWDLLTDVQKLAEIAAAGRRAGVGQSGVQPQRRLPTPSEIADRTAVLPEKLGSGPEPDKDHGR